MIFYFFYFLISPLLFLFIHIIKFFNKKIKDHLDNETDSIKNVIISLSQIDRTKIKKKPIIGRYISGKAINDKKDRNLSKLYIASLKPLPKLTKINIGGISPINVPIK